METQKRRLAQTMNATTLAKATESRAGIKKKVRQREKEFAAAVAGARNST